MPGRPKLPNDSRRTHELHVRLNQAEWDALNLKFPQTTKKRRADYVRAIIVRQRIQSRIDAQELSALARIGANLNQIAKRLNERRRVEERDVRQAQNALIAYLDRNHYKT